MEAAMVVEPRAAAMEAVRTEAISAVALMAAVSTEAMEVAEAEPAALATAARA